MNGAEEKTEFREVPPELKAILEAHRRWVASEGREGAKASLRKADLSRTDLQGAQLCEADLSGADLSKADLQDARLRGADLSEASLMQARLSRAD
ncbi:pentapeptide repeat-containing protein, partial [bacterium]|nr:pentapeptide repeat-containing protein [bacterium]